MVATSKRFGLLVVKLLPRLYERQGLAAADGLVQVDEDKPYRLLIANMGRCPQTITKKRVVATVLPHPTAVVRSPIRVGEVIGVTKEIERDSLESTPATDDRRSKVNEKYPRGIMKNKSQLS